MTTLETIQRVITITILYFGPILAIYLIYRIFQNQKKTQEKEEKSENYIILKVSVPKNNEKSPLSAEHMFASIHGIFKKDIIVQDQISFEIVSYQKTIRFYCHVPNYLKDFVEGQIYAQYPTAEIDEADDYIKETEPNFCIYGAELKLNKDEVYPIKTFTDLSVDPLAGITGVMSQADLHDLIALQIIIKPVGDSWQDKGNALVKSIKSGVPIGGVPFKDMFKKEVKKFFSDLFKLSYSQPAGKEEKKEKVLSGPQDEGVKSIETKTKKLGFETKVRIVAVCKNEQLAQSKVRGVVGTFKQFNTTNLNGFSADEVEGKEFLEKYLLRDYSESGFILNIEELASLYHFPSETVETPTIVWSGSKKGEPPSNLPLVETTPPDQLTVLGKVYFRNISHKFGIKVPDRRLHVYSIGKTGTGKSTLFENMLFDDVKEGRGVAVVDPHGDLVDAVLNFVPDERINDVIYFNPADHKNPIGFNLLENVDPDLKNIVASGVVGIFKKIFGESWGPRLEYILRNVILALLEYKKASLLDVTRILVDRGFRSEVVATVEDPVIRDFFVKEYEQYDDKFRTEAISPIQNKVGQFLSSTTIRNIVGQAHSTINIEEIMDQQKILLVDLSTGKIGEDNSALLGAMMITKIQMAAMRRVNIPKEERKNFFLYVDEFQNFATDSFATILSEARKYGLGLMVTNQYIAQMPDVVANAIFGNVGTMISFRVGPTDASVLAKEFAPVFDENDLINLDNYKAYIKMSIDGVTSQAFSAAPLPPPGAVHPENREKAIQASLDKYSRSKADVEGEINDHMGKSDFDPTVLSTLEPEKLKEEIKAVETVIYKIGDQEFKNLKDKKSGMKWFIPREEYEKFEEKIKDKQKEIDEIAERTRGGEPKKEDNDGQSANTNGSDNNIVRRSEETEEKGEKTTNQESEAVGEKAKEDLPIEKKDQEATGDTVKKGTIKPGETVKFNSDFI
ncbi:MAG: type IV secretion system DNA-binding domain-containing protein [Patescibacteria group bacterium]